MRADGTQGNPSSFGTRPNSGHFKQNRKPLGSERTRRIASHVKLSLSPCSLRRRYQYKFGSSPQIAADRPSVVPKTSELAKKLCCNTRLGHALQLLAHVALPWCLFSLFKDASYKITPHFSWGKSLAVKVSPETSRPGRVISNLMLQAFIVMTRTLTTVLHVVYTLTQICVSRLAATVATGGTTLNVQVSKGYPRK